MDKIETYKTTLVIKTENQDFEININSSIARGWDDLQKVITKEIQDADDLQILAQTDKRASACLFVTREVENAKAYIEALRVALAPSEFAKVEGVLEYMDIRGLRAIATEILSLYTAYYNARLEEFTR